MDAEVTARVVQLAEGQHGVLAHGQLLALGLAATAVGSLVRRGVLRRLHRGVYALGHRALRPEGRWLAAVLACREGAVLSHTSAARLWSLSSVPADPAVHVTVPRRRRRHPGLVVHRHGLTPADVTVHRGVPVTTVARTYVDVAAIVPFAALRAMADHGVRLDGAAVRRAAERSSNPRGRVALRRLLGDEIRTRSGLERALRRIAREVGLPAPLVNHRVVGRERDFAWPALGLVVEVDGHAYHAPLGARERDHERDAELVLAGWRVLRFTDAQVGNERDRVRAALVAAASGHEGVVSTLK
jgi:very-short-patch-repair endonuclease/predicted transcriptional regulator of viral defense system